MKRIGFTAQEKQDMLAFLRSLTDSTFLTDPRFSNPWKSR
jgi:cytochrome c peroxidase